MKRTILIRDTAAIGLEGKGLRAKEREKERRGSLSVRMQNGLCIPVAKIAFRN